MVNTLLINRWILASDITRQLFGEDGGHKTNDETAMVQAANPTLVHGELFTGIVTATSLPNPGDGWSATPFPSSVLVYTDGQGLPKDRSQGKAEEYFHKVVANVRALILDTLRKWALAGFKSCQTAELSEQAKNGLKVVGPAKRRRKMHAVLPPIPPSLTRILLRDILLRQKRAPSSLAPDEQND